MVCWRSRPTWGRKIVETITAQTAQLATPSVRESSADRLSRIVKAATGSKRPSVFIEVKERSRSGSDFLAKTELGKILLRAGFAVVDEKSEIKPDIVLTGSSEAETAAKKSGVFSAACNISLKIQERQSGEILGFDSQHSSASGAGESPARYAATLQAVDVLAERLLPVLSK